MKRIFGSAALALLVACGRTAPPPDDPAALSPQDSATALAAGEIATTVAQGLVQQLQTRMARDGAAGAVDFCATTALALTDSLSRTVAPDASVKRTSLRVRNPQNAPDELERRALAWYDSLRAAGQPLPTHHLQASADELRYYRPVMVLPFCESCHGTAERLDPAAREMIEARYPDDAATGYREDDWRGLIRVSVPRNAVGVGTR